MTILEYCIEEVDPLTKQQPEATGYQLAKVVEAVAIMRSTLSQEYGSGINLSLLKA